MDAAGDIFFIDAYNDRIREVNHATGVISTVAGKGFVSLPYAYTGEGGPATAAELAWPSSVAVDAAGDLFIADYDANRILEVKNGLISTLVGNGTAGYSGDGHQATAAELSHPSGIALDGSGDLFITDSYNDCVREVAYNGTSYATSTITTVAGNGTAGSAGDGGLATAAELNGPSGIAVDSAGDLYIADYMESRVREVIYNETSYTTSTITTLAGSAARVRSATAARPPPPSCTTPRASRSTAAAISSSPTAATSGSARSTLPPTSSPR